MRSILEGHPPGFAISRSCPVETLRQYNLAQRREDKKKALARPVIGQSYLGDDAPVAVIPVIREMAKIKLNLPIACRQTLEI
jgi:hypothetical protein